MSLGSHQRLQLEFPCVSNLAPDRLYFRNLLCGLICYQNHNKFVFIKCFDLVFVSLSTFYPGQQRVFVSAHLSTTYLCRCRSLTSLLTRRGKKKGSCAPSFCEIYRQKSPNSHQGPSMAPEGKCRNTIWKSICIALTGYAILPLHITVQRYASHAHLVMPVTLRLPLL